MSQALLVSNWVQEFNSDGFDCQFDDSTTYETGRLNDLKNDITN